MEDERIESRFTAIYEQTYPAVLRLSLIHIYRYQHGIEQLGRFHTTEQGTGVEPFDTWVGMMCLAFFQLLPSPGTQRRVFALPDIAALQIALGQAVPDEIKCHHCDPPFLSIIPKAMRWPARAG